MSAHTLLNLLYDFGKIIKMRGLPSFLLLFRSELNKFNHEHDCYILFII